MFFDRKLPILNSLKVFGMFLARFFFVVTNKLTFNVETFLLSRTQKKLIRHLVSFENLQQVHCLTVDKRNNYKDCNLMLSFFHFQLHAFCLIKLLINKYGSSYNLLRDKFLLLEVLRTKNCSGDK